MLTTLRYLIPGVFLLLPSLTHAWNLEKDDANIQVYTKTVPDSPFKAFRGTMRIRAKLEDALSVIQDVGKMSEWIDECAVSKELESPSVDEIIVYQETNAPWPVSDRNFVLHMKTERAPDGLSARVDFSAVPEAELDNEDCVQVTQLTGYWELSTKDQELWILYETTADPAGSIPAWLANAFVVDQPFHTLYNLRQRISQEDAQTK